MRNLIVGLNCRVMLFFVLILTTFINAQTIEYKKNIADTIKFGYEQDVKGAYNLGDATILLNKDWVDAPSIRIFLHELGHHIWFNGGIDTTAILNLAGDYLTRIDVMELFAEQHVKYFFNEAAPAFRNIFDAFYNRNKNKK